ncbi:hypothetical protein EZS27_020590 [termite gut metagenome]|uniref:ISXO2-like transposase domain-containing protein n=1 Tax=termite gut metagenome TaxID=433724 RepID=A0A5J4R9K1_9ZZZZ
MGKRDDIHSLSGQVELGNAFIATLIPDDQKDEALKRGVGSQNKSKVLVMTESTFVENPKQGKPHKAVNRIKMKTVCDLKAETTTNMVKENVDSQAELTADASASCKKLKEHVKRQDAKVVRQGDLPKVLPWVHIAIDNVKRLLLDVHHQLKNEYLQYCLNEFCYKFNRRHFGENLFDRMIRVAANYRTDFKSKIYNRSLCG